MATPSAQQHGVKRRKLPQATSSAALAAFAAPDNVECDPATRTSSSCPHHDSGGGTDALQSTHTQYTRQLEVLASLDRARALPRACEAVVSVGTLARVLGHLLSRTSLPSALSTDVEELARAAVASAAVVEGAFVAKAGRAASGPPLASSGSPVAARGSPVAAWSRLESLPGVLIQEVGSYFLQVEILGPLFNTSRRLRAQVLAPGGARRLTINTPDDVRQALLLLSPAALRAVRVFRFWTSLQSRWSPALARLTGMLGPHLRTLDLQERKCMRQKAIVSPTVWHSLEELRLTLCGIPMLVDEAPTALPALRRLSLCTASQGAGAAAAAVAAITDIADSGGTMKRCRALNFVRAAPALRLQALHINLPCWTAEFGRELARLAPGLESLLIEVDSVQAGGEIVRLPPLPRVRILSLTHGRFEMSAEPHPELRTLLLGRQVVARVATPPSPSSSPDDGPCVHVDYRVSDYQWNVGVGGRLDAPKLHTLNLPAGRSCAANVRALASAGALERLKFECAFGYKYGGPSCDCTDFAAVLADAAFAKLRVVCADLHCCTRIQSALGTFCALPQLTELHVEFVSSLPSPQWWAAQRFGASLRGVAFPIGDSPRPSSLPHHITWGSIHYTPVSPPWPLT